MAQQCRDHRIIEITRRVGRFLTSQRERSGLSRTDAAIQLEWTPQELQRVESGKRLLSITDIRQLAALYTFDPDRVHRIQVDACPTAEESDAGGTTISPLVEPFGETDVVPASIPMTGRQLLLVLEKLEVIHCIAPAQRTPFNAVDMRVITNALGCRSERGARRLIAIAYPAFAPMLYFVRGNRSALEAIRLHTTALLVAIRRALKGAKALPLFPLFCELLRRFADGELTEEDFREIRQRAFSPPKPRRKAA